MHDPTGGRVGMAKVFDQFLEYVKGFDDVWFCRLDEMADYWLANDAG
jgi:allantoinase